MFKRFCFLLLCLMLIALCLASYKRILFKGQCPKFVELQSAGNSEISFSGIWFQYAVHPNYLQDKCIKRAFDNSFYWAQFAKTDNENFIIQYFCYENRQRKLGRQHSRSISIFVRERIPRPETIAAITKALKYNFKFPVGLLNYTDYSYCTDIEIKDATARA
ncbi:uncharacterized protein [Drosophila virilis]|uniref:uncharacterized protein isoform X2 n=1 Tax=Drosophila virilis TaxID=7244 RepID=UPI00139662F4|nr:uncharacterized protein LOC26531823 isoform X2 [Drosophila virilis]